MKSLLALAAVITLAGSAALSLPTASEYTATADEVEARAAQTVAGITPKVGASAAVGTTYQFAVLSVDPVPATVLSRNTGVATVDNNGLATAVAVGTTWIVASVFNGHCTVKDSARFTVIQPDTAPTGGGGGGTIVGDSTRGRLVWRTSCQVCHTMDKAIDLENIAMPDSAVMRRALPHVDTLSALDIIAHMHTLGAGGPLSRTTKLYQPGGTSVANDSMFAVTLFGADEWPTRITRDTLLAYNLRTIRIPLDLPVWSNESTTYDWVPGQGGLTTGQITPGVLASTLVQNRFATWRANPTIANAVLLAEGIGSKSHTVSIADAPCMYGQPSPIDQRYTNLTAQECADNHKWGATECYLTGVQALLSAEAIGAGCTTVWWETGHMFHKAQQHAKTIQDRSLNICAWIFLGTMWDWAVGEASLYFSGPCGNGGAQSLGYGRWSTFIPLVMLAHRPATSGDSKEVCRDIWSIALYGHDAYDLNALNLAYDLMLYRLDHGLQLASSKSTCTANSSTSKGNIGTAGYLGDALQEVNQTNPSVYNSLRAKADTVRARINRL